MTAPTNIRDWRGENVHFDADGKLGKLTAIYHDAESDEALFLAVKIGMFSRKQILVPVQDVVAADDHLTISWSKASIDGAPTTRSGGELPHEDEERLFRHYGIDRTPPDSLGGRRLVRR